MMDPSLSVQGMRSGPTTRKFRVCSRCVMDTTAEDIRFDDEGRCNYCTEFLAFLERWHADEPSRAVALERLVEEIREAGAGRPYDSVIGLSGGLDSSYAVYEAKRLGLRPLVVHLDNGWNSELAVNNIERLVTGLGLELYTLVLDWEQFRDLQRAFFAADVVDIEMLTDNAILGALLAVASRFRIRHVLLGTNAATEGLRMPPGWNHLKIDLRNIRAIHRRFGQLRSIRDIPLVGPLHLKIQRSLYRRQLVSFLDLLPYDTRVAKETLAGAVGWRPYEKKHYESVFTRFYQGYILPEKFGIDKRKVHFSTLICTGEIRREEALERMAEAPYEDPGLLDADWESVLRKLGMSDGEFDDYMRRPPVPHLAYPSIHSILGPVRKLRRRLPTGGGRPPLAEATEHHPAPAA